MHVKRLGPTLGGVQRDAGHGEAAFHTCVALEARTKRPADERGNLGVAVNWGIATKH